MFDEEEKIMVELECTHSYRQWQDSAIMTRRLVVAGAGSEQQLPNSMNSTRT